MKWYGISNCGLWILVLCFASLSSQGQTRHLSAKVPGTRVYFVPISGFPRGVADELAKYCSERFGLKISVLNEAPIAPDAVNQERQQAVAERVIVGMRNSFPALARDPKAILIGLTPVDIYPGSMNWRFAFGWRIAGARAAVVSSARMNLYYAGEPLPQSSPAIRLRKMVVKDIGILYYGLSQSQNPKSVLYQGIMGIQELDAVGEDF